MPRALTRFILNVSKIARYTLPVRMNKLPVGIAFLGPTRAVHIDYRHLRAVEHCRLNTLNLTWYLLVCGNHTVARCYCFIKVDRAALFEPLPLHFIDLH